MSRWIFVMLSAGCTSTDPLPVAPVAPAPATSTSALAGPPKPKEPEIESVPAPTASVAMPAPAKPVIWTCASTCTRDVPEATCTTCGGRWDEGMLGVGHCACPAKHAGDVCKDSTDCVCEVPYANSIVYEETWCDDTRCIGKNAKNGIPLGRCQLWHKTFGCRATLVTEETKLGPMRTVHVMCVD